MPSGLGFGEFRGRSMPVEVGFVVGDPILDRVLAIPAQYVADFVNHCASSCSIFKCDFKKLDPMYVRSLICAHV
jgi:hypothetical protein